jgi:hypothetical protein
MTNMMSQLSSSIPMVNVNIIFGPRGMDSLYSPLSFGGGHIPQMNPTIRGWSPLYSETNPSLNVPR